MKPFVTMIVTPENTEKRTQQRLRRSNSLVERRSNHTTTPASLHSHDSYYDSNYNNNNFSDNVTRRVLLQHLVKETERANKAESLVQDLMECIQILSTTALPSPLSSNRSTLISKKSHECSSDSSNTNERALAKDTLDNSNMDSYHHTEKLNCNRYSPRERVYTETTFLTTTSACTSSNASNLGSFCLDNNINTNTTRVDQIPRTSSSSATRINTNCASSCVSVHSVGGGSGNSSIVSSVPSNDDDDDDNNEFCSSNEIVGNLRNHDDSEVDSCMKYGVDFRKERFLRILNKIYCQDSNYNHDTILRDNFDEDDTISDKENTMKAKNCNHNTNFTIATNDDTNKNSPDRFHSVELLFNRNIGQSTNDRSETRYCTKQVYDGMWSLYCTIHAQKDRVDMLIDENDKLMKELSVMEDERKLWKHTALTNEIRLMRYKNCYEQMNSKNHELKVQRMILRNACKQMMEKKQFQLYNTIESYIVLSLVRHEQNLQKETKCEEDTTGTTKSNVGSCSVEQNQPLPENDCDQEEERTVGTINDDRAPSSLSSTTVPKIHSSSTTSNRERIIFRRLRDEEEEGTKKQSNVQDTIQEKKRLMLPIKSIPLCSSGSNSSDTPSDSVQVQVGTEHGSCSTTTKSKPIMKTFSFPTDNNDYTNKLITSKPATPTNSTNNDNTNNNIGAKLMNFFNPPLCIVPPPPTPLPRSSKVVPDDLNSTTTPPYTNSSVSFEPNNDDTIGCSPDMEQSLHVTTTDQTIEDPPPTSTTTNATTSTPTTSTSSIRQPQPPVRKHLTPILTKQDLYRTTDDQSTSATTLQHDQQHQCASDEVSEDRCHCFKKDDGTIVDLYRIDEYMNEALYGRPTVPTTPPSPTIRMAKDTSALDCGHDATSCMYDDKKKDCSPNDVVSIIDCFTITNAATIRNNLNHSPIDDDDLQPLRSLSLPMTPSFP